MKSLLIFALAIAGLTGCDATSRTIGPSTIGLNASVTEQSFTPLNLYFSNNCTGDIFLVTGTAHVVYTRSDAVSGRLQSGIHINFQAAGGMDTTTGVKYRVISNQEGTGTFGGLAFEDTQLLIFKLVGSGPTDNYVLRTQMHVTVNANGEVIASFQKGEVVCQ